MMTAPPDAPIRWKEKLGYAAGDTASCFYWQTFSMFLMIFYTDTFGLEPGAVATMFLVSRFWDALIDPIMGVIADRTKSRHGKFRPWLLWGIIPFSVSGILLFVTPNIGHSGKLLYAYITYTLVMMAYTMINVPYGALLGVISHKSEERTALASYRFVGAFLGNIVVQGTLLYLVRFFGGGNDRLGYPLAFAVYAVAAGLLFLFTFFATRERVAPPPTTNSVRTDLADLLKNGPWVTLCIIGLGTLIYISIRNAATLYYFKYYVGDQAASAAFLVTGTIFSILGALCTPYVTRFCGSKKAALIFLTLLCAVAMGAFYFVPANNLVLLYVANIALSVPNAALFPLIWSMYADTADYGEWKYKRRATGLVFSAATFAQKMGWAVGGSLAGYILGAIGFVANVEQTPHTLDAIRHMMSTIPAAVALLVVGIALIYKLNAAFEQRLARELTKKQQEILVET
jgi:GPH family glycoside/pentoside/hexuronide:cation symporter